MWHESMKSLYIGIYELKTVSHVRIGTGENVRLPTPIDNAQARILRIDTTTRGHKYTIYIPASSIHGVLRSAVEDALRTYFYNGNSYKTFENLVSTNDKNLKNWLEKSAKGLQDIYLESLDELPLFGPVCYPTLEFDACQIPVRGAERRNYFKQIGRVKKTKDSGDAPYICYVCQTFGATGFRGRVRVLNAYPASYLEDELALDIISRNAIDRVTGAAAENRLFDIEAIPPGTIFYFALIVENALENVTYLKETPNSSDYGDGIRKLLNKDGKHAKFINLVNIGINMLSSGLVGIGAHNTVGFGYVEISPIIELEVRNVKVFAKEYLLKSENPSLHDLIKKDEYRENINLKVDKQRIQRIDLIEDLYPKIIKDLIKAATME